MAWYVGQMLSVAMNDLMSIDTGSQLRVAIASVRSGWDECEAESKIKGALEEGVWLFDV